MELYGYGAPVRRLFGAALGPFKISAQLCSGQFNGTNGHIDTFNTSNQACNPHSSADYGNVSTLTLNTPSGNRQIQLPGTQDEIQQVCPIAGNRLMVFGYFGGYFVYIIDLTASTVIDHFAAYSPVLSPDQRWLIMRQFYPPHTDFVVSEQYLLYDLTATPASNRRGHTPYTSEIAGRMLYPVSSDGSPFNILNIPDSERHTFRSASFYWSSNSRYVAFADSVGGSLSIVLVSATGASAVVHPVSDKNVCIEGGDLGSDGLTLTNTQIGPSTDAEATVIAAFESSGPHCTAKSLTLGLGDFRPAQSQAYPPLKRKTSVPAGKR